MVSTQLNAALQPIQVRLFLVGCPRSGTTLLQSLIATHPQIASFPESHLFVKPGISVWGNRQMRYGVAPQRLKVQLSEFLALLKIADDPQFRALIPQHSPCLRDYIRAFSNVLDRLTQQRGKTNWLEKTPGHLHFIYLIERYIPHCRFIHLLRNGLDVIASLYQVTREFPQRWGGPYTIEQCVQRWTGDIVRSLAHEQHPNHLLLDYQRLIEQPEATLHALFSFAGVADYPDALKEYPSAAERVILVEEAWKKDVMNHIHQTNGLKFRETFTQAEQATIRQQMSELLNPVQHALTNYNLGL